MDRRGESEGYLHFQSKQSLLDWINTGCTRSNIFPSAATRAAIGWNARGIRYIWRDAERLKSGTRGMSYRLVYGA